MFAQPRSDSWSLPIVLRSGENEPLPRLRSLQSILGEHITRPKRVHSDSSSSSCSDHPENNNAVDEIEAQQSHSTPHGYKCMRVGSLERTTSRDSCSQQNVEDWRDESTNVPDHNVNHLKMPGNGQIGEQLLLL